MGTKLLSVFALYAFSFSNLMADVKPEVTVCNRINVSAWVVRGYQPHGVNEAKTEGWYEIKAGACKNIAWEGAAVGDGIYLYANYSLPSGEFFAETTGDIRLCVRSGKAFDFDNAATRLCNEPQNSFKKFRRYTIPGEGKVNLNLTEAAFVRRPSLVQVCNKLNTVVWSARGYQASNVAEPMTRGWNDIKPGQCRDFSWEDAAIGSNLYVYAEFTSEDRFKNELSGDTLLCLNDTNALTQPGIKEE